MAHNHICGLYYLVPSTVTTWYQAPERKYLPQVSLSVHARIVSSTSRTTLTQTFANPSGDKNIPELRYTFPLYDGVSVVGFTCTINRDRVIKGIVKERAQARKTYEAAVARGETAGLFEQLPDASDVFTTTIGNVPPGAEIKVDITYLGELKHDAEADGIRFTIPTSIAPRYGSYPGEMLRASNVGSAGGISIIVDAEVSDGSNIKSVQSPSHPISVTIGNTSAGAASGADMSLQKASATLSLNTAELGADFVLHVVATNTANPVAVLETHPTIPNHRAMMATLVPKFNLPSSRPEIVFLCDRSGSMCSGNKIPNMKTALQVFLKSLPVGVKFNICSFGSRYELLFKNGSRSYDASSLKEASSYVDTFTSNFGGTEMYQPLEDIFKRRFKDMDLEVFLLTDGEIWDQERLFTMINKYIGESKGAIRVFTLGIGSDVSHALIEGVARAGNGFSQAVGDNENMNSKVVRMLKASLTPHVKDYTLEIKYEKQPAPVSDDDFEIVEKVMDALVLDVQDQEPESKPETKKTISLFDTNANPDVEIPDASLDKTAGGRYAHVPPVSEPKLLQTPFTIPPLFPFNRTSVYLLMSPETCQRTPKSVMLRGTSPQGPLELEIPVTILAEKGETIHQLAARQAVKELEEGRGWLYHAKDGNGPKAKLLKDKFQGRFSDMVEREAVRLGTTYQVGGKWCSFVAVDKSKQKLDSKQATSLKEKEICEDREVLGSGAPPAYASADQGWAEADDEEYDVVESHSFGAVAAPKSVFQRKRSIAPEFNRGGSAPRSAPGGGMFSLCAVSMSAAPPPPPAPQPSIAPPLCEYSCSFTPVGETRLPLPVCSTSTSCGPTKTLSSQLSSPIVDPANTVLLDGSPAAYTSYNSAYHNAGESYSSASPGPAPGFFIGSSSRGSSNSAPPPPVADRRKSGGGPAGIMSRARAVFGAPVAAAAPASQQPLAKSSAMPKKRSSRNAVAMREDSSRSDKKEGSLGSWQGTAPALPTDALEAIVARQSFEGSWAWGNGELLTALGFDVAVLGAELQSLARGFGLVFSPGTDLAATAVVLAYLEVKMAGKKDEWEMLAEKATDWIAGELKTKGASIMAVEFVEKVKEVVV